MNYSVSNNKKQKKTINSSGKRIKNKFALILIRAFTALVLVGIFAALGVGIGAYLGIIEAAPKLSTVQQGPENFTTIIYSETTGEELDRLDGGESREYAPISQIPKYLQLAFVAIEDERFYEHDGVDYRGFARAIYQTLFKNSTQGGSTITQQVVKNKLGIKRNTISTKLQEQYLATEYEKQLTESLGSKEEAKDAILETYLNVIALGKGQIGVQAAALRYFNKNVEELTLAECCVIAAITQNPTGYNPINYPEENIKRRNVALDNMLEMGYITEKEYNDAMEEDVYSRIVENEAAIKEAQSFHSYFNDQIITELSRDLQEQYALTPQEASQFIYNGGLSVYSTIDLGMQKILDDAFMNEELFPKNDYSVAVNYIVSINNSLTGKTTNHNFKKTVATLDDVETYVNAEREKVLGQNGTVADEVVYAIVQPQAGMIIIDYHNGQVKAVVGGRGEKLTNRGLNRATDSVRQPGSVFKVLSTYAPALDLGLITPATVVDDVPFTYGKYTPKNHWGSTFRGLSTARMGIRDSMNVVTVKIMQNMGVNNAMNYLKNFGFTSLVDEDYQLATSLGGITYGVNQVEVTAAYGAIANDGMLIKPYFYTKVYNHEGEVILENNPEPRQVLKKTTAFLLTNMMKDVITAGTGGQARFREVKMPVAGKTGTTSDNKDLTFVGYTPYYAAGIWLGYDMPKPMSTKTKSEHLVIWRTVMEEIHRDLPQKDFERPDGIVTAAICTQSGELAIDGLCNLDPRGSTIRNEYFAAGTVPTTSCNVHRTFTIDTESRQLANEFCPAEQVATIVGIVRPEPYTGDAPLSDRQYEVPVDLLLGITCQLHTKDSMFAEPDDNIETGPVLPENTENTGEVVMPNTTPVSGGFDTSAGPTLPATTPIPVVTPIGESEEDDWQDWD